MSRIIRNASLYTIGNILPQAAGFFLLPIYTRYLSPADYGIVNSLQVLNVILAVLFTMAIDRSVFRLYFDYKTDCSKRDFLGTITISLFFISIFVLLILFVFRGAVGQIYESIEFYPFYVYSILTAFFTVFSLVPKIYFQINEKAGKFVIISLLQFILSSALILWFIIKEREGAVGMLKGGMLASIVMALIFIFISIKTINFTFKLHIFKESLSFSLPMIPALLSAWILNMSDRIFIERYIDLHAVGLYSLAYKISSLVLIISSSITRAYKPVFYRLANSENQDDAKIKLFQYNNIYMIVVLMLMFFIIFFAKELIIILLEPKFQEAYKLVPILSLTYLIAVTSGLLNLMVYQEKKVTQLMIVGLISAALNIGLNFLLIPLFGTFGAAYATLISVSIVFVLSFKIAQKCYFIPFEWKQLLLILLVLMLIILIFYIVDFNIYTSLVIKVFICLLFALYFAAKYSSSIKNIFR